MIAEIASFIVLTLDDLGWKEWNAIAPPRLEALREAGLTFTRGYAMPNCSPTRFALQFGEYGFRHGVGFPIKVLSSSAGPDPADVTSLPEAIAGHGFRTAHFGKWHLTGKNQGLADFALAPNLHGYEDALAWSGGNLNGDGGVGFDEWTRYDNGATSTETEYATTAVLDAFAGWWRSHAGERRFAHVALHAPHAPFHAPPAALLPIGFPVPTTDAEKHRAMVLAADAAIGRALRKAEVDFSDTLLIVLTDNGTSQNVATSAFPAKGSIFEPGIHVPFFVVGPGAVPGTSSDRLVHAVDVMATVGSLVGVDPHTCPRDSVSFVGALGGHETDARRWIYADAFSPNGPGPYTKHDRTLQTHDDWKLHVTGSGASETSTLFRVPNELLPVLDPVKTAELRAIMNALGS